MTSDNEVSQSRFYMLRCVVAMAHADGIVTEEERAYIEGLMNKAPLSEEQKNILKDDLENPQQINDLLPFINESNYRSQILYFARLMAFKDGHFHPSEQDLIEKLRSYMIKGRDLKAVSKNVHEITETEMSLHDIKVEKNRPQKGGHFVPWMKIFDEALLALGIDISRD